MEDRKISRLVAGYSDNSRMSYRVNHDYPNPILKIIEQTGSDPLSYIVSWEDGKTHRVFYPCVVEYFKTDQELLTSLGAKLSGH